MDSMTHPNLESTRRQLQQIHTRGRTDAEGWDILAGWVMEREAAKAGTWRPITDIPDDIRHDGSVLLYKPDEPRSGPEMVVGYWGEWPGVDGCCWIRAGGRPIAWTSMWTDEPVPHGIVTHWMPLPERPDALRAAAERAGDAG